MALSKKPTTGMRDILPEEMQIRDYVSGVIRDTYKRYGFTPIETPCVENIANLTNKQGGDNEKLIFKILKRGEKLKIAEALTEEEVVDGGLRYDLTVPLDWRATRQCSPAPGSLQGPADGQRVAGGQAPEGALPPVYPVRYRHFRGGLQSGGDRADFGHHHHPWENRLQRL